MAAMLSLITACLPFALLFYFIVLPISAYFYDSKGFRKYTNQNLFSGITNLAYIFEAKNRFRTNRLYELHQKHPIIRLGPSSLSFSNPRAIKDIYGHNTSCVKGDMYAVQQGSHASLLDSVNKPEHARKRKLLSNAFALSNVERWEHKVADKVLRLVQQLDRQCTSPIQSANEKPEPQDLTVDWRKWSNFFTIDAIADIGMSDRLFVLDSGHDRLTVRGSDDSKRQFHFIESLHGGHRVNSSIVWSTEWFKILKIITSYVSKSFRIQYERSANYTLIFNDIVRRRLQKYDDGEKLDDFVARLLHTKEGTPLKLDVEEVEAEVNVFMNAGSDTTAIALCNILYYLLKNPTKLAELRNELDAAISNNNTVVIPYVKVKSLPYFQACLDESLRLSPPVSFGLMRKTPSPGTTIASEYIPGNTTVSLPAYVAHRNPRIFPDPEAFLPERWLIDDASRLREMRGNFLAFSTGARGCIGRNISYLEQHVLIATVLRRYEFALESPKWKLEWEEGFNLWPGEMPVKIWRRDGLGMVEVS